MKIFAMKIFASLMTKKLIIFDVDGTLAYPQAEVDKEVIAALKDLSERHTTMIVSGSDSNKVLKQFGVTEVGDLLRTGPKLHYALFENGLVGYKYDGCLLELHRKRFIDHLGEEAYQELVNRILNLFSEIKLPFKRGTFVELRAATLNISPVGRSCTPAERKRFEEYDQTQKLLLRIRDTLETEFGRKFDLEFALGGQISLDVYPRGWDKSYLFNYIDVQPFDEIHFFGDRCGPKGNDFPLYSNPRVTHRYWVTMPRETLEKLREL